MEEFIERLNNYLTNEFRLPPRLSGSIACRGLCGEINVNLLLCKDFKRIFGLTKITNDDGIIMYEVNGIYIKKCCICENQCTDDKPCILTRGSKCDGHYIVIISENNESTINENDYVLDYTYKQMLVPQKDEDVDIPFLNSLPTYLLLPYEQFLEYVQYINSLMLTDTHIIRWLDNITLPCKFIVNADCDAARRGRGRTIKSNKKSKLISRKRKRMNSHKKSKRLTIQKIRKG
jgi:hypothetical protein